LARALQDACDENPNLDPEYLARGVLAYAVGDVQFTPAQVKEINLNPYSVYSASSFGKCMLNKMGLAQIRNMAKYIFSSKTRKLLKSRQYRKASALIIKLIRKYAPRVVGKRASRWVTKKAIKALARFGLPGVDGGTVAWYAAKCGWSELR